MRYVISIDVENDAFQPRRADEVARILREHADLVARYGLLKGDCNLLYDANGNLVGEANMVN